MVWHEIFPRHKHAKLHRFCKNGVVLHHLATLFDNTSAVSKPEHDDQIVHGVRNLPNIYEILPNCKWYCQNTAEILQNFFHDLL